MVSINLRDFIFDGGWFGRNETRNFSGELARDNEGCYLDDKMDLVLMELIGKIMEIF
ncbi:MAG: hypothetical protein KKF68_02030 [Nanoarchaeota archaeon]|nr:hypothetical protein [Nanoarchaeota archaeon]